MKKHYPGNHSLKITVLSCVFPPEPVVSAKLSQSIVRELTGRGHVVTVITSFPNRPAGKIIEGYKSALYKMQNSDSSSKILRCFSFISPKASFLNRWIENISFGITSGLALFFMPRPDVVYSNSWPIFATGLAAIVCVIRKIPIIIHVQDLYPESLVIQERIVEKSIIFKLLMTLDAWIAKAATSIIVLSENFASSYVKKRGVDPTRMHIIPNWVEAENFENFEKDSFRQRSGISKEAFVIVYGGNIGYAAGVELVIDSLKEISSTREIVFLIAGDGSQMKFCQESAQAVKNIRVIFHNPWLAEETAQTLASADLLLLPTRGRQSLASVPSKLLSYLMSARPILALVCPDSDTAQIIEKAGCGWVIEPNSKDSFVKKILELSEYPAEKLADIGAAGRKYALEHFVDKVCLPGLIDIIIGAG